ncbi:MAG: DUF3048 domain-containing protein [Tissierellia bacterium]|nr:DUF3048 domain-containing protein [Tissierellia bacterium]MDD4781387.1 DUF3048 domain-containing protein [Tissierellia bacterium]
MKKNYTLMIMLLFVLLIFTSCSKDNEVLGPNDNEEIKNNEEVEESPNNEEESEDDPNKIFSTLDGLKYYPDELKKRPVAVSIDNHPSARWQAGLSQAEIIYEFEVEHPYTRYLCVFLAKEPNRIGPVRSARPYIIYYALENDGIFVHVGGSEDAFSEISRLKVADIDGLYSGSMWRYNETGKYAPHNMYTTLKEIRDEAQKKGYRTEGTFEGYEFHEKSTNLSDTYETINAEKINIAYNKDNSTDYIYDKEKEVYLRFKDGKKHIDELNNEQLTAKNIIVIETSKKVLDNAGRLYLGTIGEGHGVYITNGESTSITWTKSSESAQTKFHINNEELKLNPGNTWIQILNTLDCIKYE